MISFLILLLLFYIIGLIYVFFSSFVAFDLVCLTYFVLFCVASHQQLIVTLCSDTCKGFVLSIEIQPNNNN